MKASIGKIAKELGVSRDTLRRWEAKGKIIAERTPRGHRRYDLAKILGLLPRGLALSRNTVAYARVSSHDQKEDLIPFAKNKDIFQLRESCRISMIASSIVLMQYNAACDHRNATL
jgi:putative resolvase